MFHLSDVFIFYLLTCAASSDYALLDTVVVFPVGASDGDRQCVNVTILQDDVVEGTEYFFMQASHVPNAFSLIVIDPSLSLTTVSIADGASECRILYFTELPSMY